MIEYEEIGIEDKGKLQALRIGVIAVLTLGAGLLVTAAGVSSGELDSESILGAVADLVEGEWRWAWILIYPALLVGIPVAGRQTHRSWQGDLRWSPRVLAWTIHTAALGIAALGVIVWLLISVTT